MMANDSKRPYDFEGNLSDFLKEELNNFLEMIASEADGPVKAQQYGQRVIAAVTEMVNNTDWPAAVQAAKEKRERMAEWRNRLGDLPTSGDDEDG
jgi:hypothetical protein